VCRNERRTKTDKQSRNEKNGSISRESQSGVSMVRDLSWKELTEEVDFEFRVKE